MSTVFASSPRRRKETGSNLTFVFPEESSSTQVNKTMEFYAVVNKATGKTVNGFPTKDVAKTERNRLQEATKQGLPEKGQREDQSAWTFKVSRGKDHPRNQVQ